LKRAGFAWGVTLVLGTAVDQWTKHWAQVNVRPVGKVTLVPDVLDLLYTENAGAFFSLGASLPEAVRRTSFVIAAVVAITAIGALYAKTHAGQVRLRAALALLASGALGNLVDRVVRGSVVDFVHLHAGAVFRWATFNVADVLITAGLVLLAFELLRPSERAGQAPGSPGHSRAAAEGTR
jgi:signal peptidase II